MLKRATAEDFNEILRLCGDDLIGTRILCYILAYGFERDFLEIWIIKENEVVIGVLAKFYDDVTLLCKDSADIEQLSAFIGMFYFGKLMCKAELCEKLGFENITVKKAYVYNGYETDFPSESLEEENYEKAYSLISTEIPGSFSKDNEAYLSFLSDFTFRKRRSLARGVCSTDNGEVISVALTSSETETSAVISGVACNRSKQKHGLGKKTVLSLVNELKRNNKKAYVIALNESAEGFYEHIGFEMTGKIAFVERNNNV